jgi:hypothetical protein
MSQTKTHGMCTYCRKSVQLIYANPQLRSELVIGPHSDLTVSGMSVTQKSPVPLHCRGSGKPGIALTEATRE